LRHAPQFVFDVFVFVSQPLATLPSQLPQPALQLASWQPPPTQPAVPFGYDGQALPHVPQLDADVWRFVSQPFDCALPSQLPKPELQAMAHVPLLQKPVPFWFEQTTPQPPQFAGSNFVLVQPPPHWVSPAPHETAQTPFEQTWPAPQTLPHAPQLTLSDVRFAHVPLQFVRPAWQLTAHAPFEHT
jgi:hypothetical protein